MLTQWLTSLWRRTMIVAALFAMLLVGAPQKVHALSASQLIALTNTQRSASGLAPLAVNSKLNASAAAKARHMDTQGYWAHTAPDGTSPWTFVRSAGYAYTVVGENLAKDFSSDQAVVAAWMGSATHRANILNPRFKDVGIAIYGSIVVAHYGATAAASSVSNPKPAVPNTTVPQSKPKPQPAKNNKPVAAKPKPTAAPKPVAVQRPVAAVQPVKAALPEKEPRELLLEQLAKIIDRGDGRQTALALVQ